MPHWALILLWPLMQTVVQPVALGTRWNPAGTFEAGLDNLAAVVVCNAPQTSGGPLIAIDSTGNIVEMAFRDGRWTELRSFPTGLQVTAACAGATRGKDQDDELFLATPAGQVVALTRTLVGWSSQVIAKHKGPILFLRTTPMRPGLATSLFVIDGDSLITEYVRGNGEWLSGRLPPIPGGATKVCFHYFKDRLTVSAAGGRGVIYRVDVDSAGIWRPNPWGHLSAAPLDMAASIDPTGRDIALFYSGVDGAFRYLFARRTDDEISPLPVGNATNFLVGAGDWRRFNEFFAMSGNEFCLFEFDTGLQDWVKIPVASISKPVVSIEFASGRVVGDFQFYIACVDGTVYEFIRAPAPEAENE